MEGTDVPFGAWLAFGMAWVAGLTLFACLFVITRRLGMAWHRRLGGYNLEFQDAKRLGKMMFGLEQSEPQVVPFVWAVRSSWAIMLVSVLVFVVMLAGAA